MIWVRLPSRTPFLLKYKLSYDRMKKKETRRYSLVVKQILGKDQRTVQFCLSAPLENSVELFRKENTLNRDQSVKRIDFLLI